jgi:peptidoglycan/LPS O-acetylase OafA/YrhL
LIPYWSLAVEEQFYLVWPLVVARFAGKALTRVIVAVCLTAMLLRFAGLAAGVAREAIYANTLTRMDSLLIGAACAVCVRDERLRGRLRPLARWLWLAPLAPFIALRWTATSPKTLDPMVQTIGFTVIALSYAGLLLAAVLGGPSPLQRFLSSRIMRALGKYSYAAYLWHYLTMRIVWKIGVHFHAGNIVVMIAVTMLMSIASYHLIERWFLRLKGRFEPRFAVTAAAGN